MAISLSLPQALQKTIRSRQRTWAITGVAGFIGSNLLEALLTLGQRVNGIDNMVSGSEENLESVRLRVGESLWRNFEMTRGDIREIDDCKRVCRGADVVLHHAALCSVADSLENPLSHHQTNVDGTANVLQAASETDVRRFIFASSSAVYGDDTELPSIERRTGVALSPYALTKQVNELYAETFARLAGFRAVGLRYFNVFGPRQDPYAGYAAVIPRWISTLLDGRQCEIFGDGYDTRDFCYVDNAVQACLLAADADLGAKPFEAFNIATGVSTSLRQLYAAIATEIAEWVGPKAPKPLYSESRPGNIRHSCASIDKARTILGYSPTHGVKEGLKLTLRWHLEMREGGGRSAATQGSKQTA